MGPSDRPLAERVDEALLLAWVVTPWIGLGAMLVTPQAVMLVPLQFYGLLARRPPGSGPARPGPMP